MEDKLQSHRKFVKNAESKKAINYSSSYRQGILFKPIPNLLDMAGIDAGYATVEQVNKMIDILREEYLA